MPAPYAELHCHSAFSFLDGASQPEELVEEAARLGLGALALTDHGGLYGVVRFAVAGVRAGLPCVFGAELTLPCVQRAGGVHDAVRDRTPTVPDGGPVPVPSRSLRAGPERTGVPDPPGEHLVVLARDPEGYRRLSSAITGAQLAGAKARPFFSLAALAAAHGGHWLVLTGCRKGPLTRALEGVGPAAAGRRLAELVSAFGRDNVAVELTDHGDPLDGARNDALAELAVSSGVEPVATGNVHYATPAGRHLAAVLAAVRAGRSLAELDGWLSAHGGAHLRSAAEQARRFARYPGAVERAAELGRACAFDLALVAPGLPAYPVPEGHTEWSFLAALVAGGAARRYGPRHAERVRGAWDQLDHELAVIDELGFAGYFLVVWDIVEFCRRSNILCQGRGSAANSAVCYVLGITAADAVSLGLLFERFLSPERDGPPDIDLDIESGRREEVITYVYERWGRTNAAQVANVISYRTRSALRDVGRALGYQEREIAGWSRRVRRGGLLPGDRDPAGRAHHDAGTVDAELPGMLARLAGEIRDLPRHLGIHPGGMVLTRRPVAEVCPVEWATAPGRSVLQWDKDDCAAAGLVKFDLLGLGMLEALHRVIDLVAALTGEAVDLGGLPQEDAVYDMLCRADSVGVFQVESRAQMATLPRLQPRSFYDLVVEVALIRPGPIQGGSVHPYLRRRAGEEPVTYPHPLVETALAKTLGVPLFQEQLMRIAIDAAGFSAREADALRAAMGAKRSAARMAALRARLLAGMAERGIGEAAAATICTQLEAFANFGFPESHAISFAYLVYASAWFKLHHPGAFLAALLDAQPMGFWSPATLVADARRHGVTVHGPDVNRSGTGALLVDGHTVRLGLGSVRGIGHGVAKRIVTARDGAGGQADAAAGAGGQADAAAGAGGQANGESGGAGAFTSAEDLARRAALKPVQVEALACAGALTSLGYADRRAAIWDAYGAAAAAAPGRLPGFPRRPPPPLPQEDPHESAAIDIVATGIPLGSHPVALVRNELVARGVLCASELAGLPNAGKVVVAGVITHRQRPGTARGVVFVNLEDETGLVNVIFSPGAWLRWRDVAGEEPAIIVAGQLERAGGAVSVRAERVEPLSVAATAGSRDYR